MPVAPAIPPIVPAVPALPVPVTPVAPPLPAVAAAPKPVAPVAPQPPPAAPAATPLPPAPEKVSVSLEGSTAVVKWNPVPGKNLAGYLVYRAFPGDDIGAPLMGNPIADTAWKDRTAQEGKTYVYWVVAQSLEGTQGPASSRQTVEVPKSGGVVPFF